MNEEVSIKQQKDSILKPGDALEETGETSYRPFVIKDSNYIMIEQFLILHESATSNIEIRSSNYLIDKSPIFKKETTPIHHY